MTAIERRMISEALSRPNPKPRARQELEQRSRTVEGNYEHRRVQSAIASLPVPTTVCECCGLAGIVGDCPSCSPAWCVNCGDCALHCHCGAFERACKAT